MKPEISSPEEELPLRAELFSAQQMEQYGHTLAQAHRLSPDAGPDKLLSRLADNQLRIEAACRLLTDTIKAGRQVTPAAEWLLDNFYLIDEQIRTARLHLPKNYSRALPRLENRQFAGRPRVYDIALETIAHGDGRIDPEILSRFVAAYQQRTTLQLGELWAIPIMLRLALIENLRRVAARLATTREHRNLAHQWADSMLEVAERNPAELILLVADMARSEPVLESSFVAELVRRLQGQNPALALPLTWLSQRLAAAGETIDELIQREGQRQAADQVSISNSIGSLRFLKGMDWREFVETMSAVEQTLRQDPGDAYARMDFATRDRYRHAVERIARLARSEEHAVATQALALARHARQTCGADDRRSHVGYYLIGDGRRWLEDAVGINRTGGAANRLMLAKRPLAAYLGSMSLLTLALLACLMNLALHSGAQHWHTAWLILFGLVLALPCSQLAQAVVNWLTPFAVAPALLPRMDFSTGIPPESGTLVVVPSLLQSVAGVETLVDALEVRFLANQDRHLRFCLLTDFGDADREHLAGDAALVETACQHISRLNLNYPRPNGDAFLLLHRPRHWNAAEGTWMALERKRGKLAALNALLVEGVTDTFSVIHGDPEGLGNIRYVITLDTDTDLPRDAARQLVATMAHPLNRPVYAPVGNIVVAGYGILQPRITVSAPSPDASSFELLFGGEIGIDPYTRAVSDVYQDLFGEGSFTGKGIYDVNAFERVLHKRMPDNRILSHDLLEGCYARCGLVSDVQLNEHYPSRYSADVKRRHRWIRGDWQIAAWLMPYVPLAKPSGARATQREKNPLSALSRWKLFDNLRRSLVSPTLVAMPLIGWFLLDDGWQWTIAMLLVVMLPAALASLFGLLRKPAENSLRQHLSGAMRDLRTQLLHGVLAISLLPYEAWYQIDAILRTQWRLRLSHRRLLEWRSSGDINQPATVRLRNYYRIMWPSPLLALAAAMTLDVMRPVALMAALPVLLLWWVAPYLVFRLSLPMARQPAVLDDQQRRYLGSLSRKIWLFFETYVGPADNWLPPDNFQEHPVGLLARRTSPTNIGLALLANVSAHDFGYICGAQLVQRTHNTFQSMALLDRYQGHFYNWYDTQNLRPLLPEYVSTVDSGNLGGHLLTLVPALNALVDDKLLHPRLFQGIDDTWRILDELAASSPCPVPASFGETLQAALDLAPGDAAGSYAALQRLARYAAQFNQQLTTIAAVTAATSVTAATAATPAIAQWAQALDTQCSAALEQLDTLAPWLSMTVLPDALKPIAALLEAPLTLRHIARLDSLVRAALKASAADAAPSQQLLIQIRHASTVASSRLQQIDTLVTQAGEFARMQYRFLYDPSSHLLAIGYNVTQHCRDTGAYDLLASEARLATFVGIAQGQLPQESWFALGRQLTLAGGKPILLSWSGSMFEYLMPLLVMPTFRGTLLDQTYHTVVEAQISYGAQRGIFWGMSESGYNAFDASLNYQYRTFGIPGLGFKRGLSDDLVVAPYASMMALMVSPQAACHNLQQMHDAGLEGNYGFYEAVDYTPSRLSRGQSNVVVRSFMAHHQGMGLLSLAYVLLDQPMQKRFEAVPLFQATMSLLHERVPKAGTNYSTASGLADASAVQSDHDLPIRVIHRPDPKVPEVQLLSNGRYHVMLTSAGGSYSRWGDLALTRWREDGTRDHWGTFCYVQDMSDGAFWSTACQPVQTVPAQYEVIFSEGRAEFRHHEREFDMHTEIVVSPEDDIELRRTRITNRSTMARTIELTSYAEVVLAPAAADAMHQAFSNLFVQTEIDPQRGAILCTRRPRSNDENAPWMFHLMAVHGVAASATSYETDRMQFLGRGNTPAHPKAMQGPLSGSAGSVLDPIVAIRHRITLEPEQSVTCDMVNGIAPTREAGLALIDKYRDRHLADRVVELAWTHNQVVLRQLNASEADAQLYGRLANSVIHANPMLRSDASILARNRRGQSALWSYSISGDLPIVLVQVRDMANLELVRQLVQAHAYWRSRGLAVDLVIWNEDHALYRQALQEQILGLISSVTGAHAIDRPGGIFVRLADQISQEDRILFLSVARVILSDRNGTLADQINRRDPAEVRMPLLLSSSTASAGAKKTLDYRLPTPATKASPLFDNGIGGFNADGSEYRIVTRADQGTPAPWCNVIANATFGTVISESGQSYSWADNAHEFRLTPWDNDPVSDGSGEVFYLRDEQSGQFWSPTQLPCRGNGEYVTRHGFGYSVFEHLERGIFSELTVYVSLDASVKYSVLRVRNDSDQPRQLSATGYVEWVLGDLRAKTAMHVATEIDPVTGALFARNHYNTEFPHRVAFFDVDAAKSVTSDRCEFIGRNRSLANPLALSRQRLSGRSGAGLDPCAALQVPFELNPGQEKSLVFVMGVADSREQDPSALVMHHRHSGTAHEAVQAVHRYWRRTLGTIRITTPDPAIDVLANGWLLYQTLACRLWARSGYYQSGGAFGFRDQLQDVMALVHSEPALARAHLLLCATRQFPEGDVQHWWHPPTGRGVRTRCSDDYLWLPLALCRYISVTGDMAVLDATATFIEGRPLSAEEDSYYDLPSSSPHAAPLYEHCVRAIRHGLDVGSHGLALIGSCDWNDGMDKVGEHGKGESVWLSFFLVEVLSCFAGIALRHGDAAFAASCNEQAALLTKNIAAHGWDGEWYLRAFFDDGTPLGASANAECRIDSISQSWAVLSGAGDPARCRQAMTAVKSHLVRHDARLIQLLDPPFDHAGHNPGYIRGYVPGVRENGGQYTHAAIWTIMAFARLGDAASAWQLMDMINPINHGRTLQEINTYKVEPYVVAADVYAKTPHTGRGGWTWYTGSAGWMYRLLTESLLGLNVEGEQLRITPCLPPDWKSYQLDYRYRDTLYRITVRQEPAADSTQCRYLLDGVHQRLDYIALVDDGQERLAEVTLYRIP